ncbi:MAG: tetratricopeptide repeat protein [Betaproteobacteria bacterium]|nr:tetratricopeptide repeat protein [Betaproteobacteria bacterium]
MRSKVDEVIECYQQELKINPGNVDTCLNLGALLHNRGELNEARKIYKEFIKYNPDCAEVFCNLGIALIGLNEHDEALAAFEMALEHNPKLAAAYFNLGNAQRILGKLTEASHAYQRAIHLKPDYKSAYKNLGNVQQAQGQLADAERHLKKALEIDKDDAQTINNLANVFKHQGLHDKAIASYRQALSLNPNDFEVHSNLLYALSSNSACSPDQYLQEAKQYSEKALARVKPYASWLTGSNEKKSRCIRVGLVSGDLKSHPVGYFLESTLKSFDQARFELVAYSARVQEDDLTNRIKPYFHAWNLIAGLSDEDAAHKIHQDKIDILVDLAGHTALNRLPLFAWRPAPIQVSWLGYFASTGLKSIDYLLADPVSIPVSRHSDFSEKIWYLPEIRMCFTPPAHAGNLSVKPLPATQNGYITFGCYQALSKINDCVLKAWGKILNALPQSHLRFQNKQMGCLETRAQFKKRLAQFGIQEDSVTLLGPDTRQNYLASYAEIDILLDTFPYPGGTTTYEALWMGVPTITLAGETLLARQGASILTAAGLSNWVADNLDEYVSKAIKLSSELPCMVTLRSGLREQVRDSPLFDAQQFARNLELAFLGMYDSKKLGFENKRSAGVEVEKIFLHVGCGPRNKTHTTAGFNNETWREIRLDIDEAVNPDIVGSMTELAGIADGSIDAIFSSHNIEHLYPHEVPVALKQFIRVLKPNGFLVVTCPDLQSVCTLIADDKLADPAYTSPAGPIAPLDILYGYRPALARGNLHMAHRCGFTKKVLINTLRGSGFMTTAAVGRSHPFFDLWAVACKSEITHDDICELARQHFPS